MTLASPSSSRTAMIERASARQARSRSLGSEGSPLRTTMRVVFASLTWSRMASSISVLSALASSTMLARFSLSFAVTSSEMICGTCGDQPRMSE